MNAQISLLNPSPCRCGETLPIEEYPEEVRIGGWCMCRVEEMPIVIAKTVPEAMEKWEMARCN